MEGAARKGGLGGEEKWLSAMGIDTTLTAARSSGNASARVRSLSLARVTVDGKVVVRSEVRSRCMCG